LALSTLKHWRQDPAHDQREAWYGPAVQPAKAVQVVLSFDVEEHFRIEAASGLAMDSSFRNYYSGRLETSTRWLLDQLDELAIKGTFFVVGELARSHAKLVRAMVQAGHEVASHSWNHQRVHHHTPGSFREDVRKSKNALEQITGQEVLGYRAPTFSVVPRTAWALDVLVELGFAYDSSIYPVWHDRYGVPKAPRGPFRAKGLQEEILELPLATWRVLRTNIPVGGGGYFRLFPLSFIERAIDQVRRSCDPAIAVLYFHPWEFDPEQKRLPLGRLNAFRTYVGIKRSRERLLTLLNGRLFTRAIEVAKDLRENWRDLVKFEVSGPNASNLYGTERAAPVS